MIRAICMQRRQRARSAERGVSLIEALVALAVMAFGLLGVVGMQATLRSNADVSKQRSEAVRMAQDQIEDWRSFERLTTQPPVSAFADIANIAGTDITSTNATYTRSAAVQNTTLGPDDPKLKSMKIDVTWQDRSGGVMAVQLVSSIAGVAPELAGSLSLPADRAATQRPGGRHVAIPPGAVNQSDGSGTSTFTPPGAADGVRWVFNNQTGLIIKTCYPVGTCIDTSLLPLSGYVQFATTGTAQPTGAQAENPESTLSPSLDISMRVDLTLPTTNAPAPICYVQRFPTYVAYFCAVPRTLEVPRQWSGRSLVQGLTLAMSMTDDTFTKYRVCRYTTGTTDTPPVDNRNHPLDYVNVTEPLSNQNFLVIRAGNGSGTGAAPFACPGDDLSTPLVNGNTYKHQPPA